MLSRKSFIRIKTYSESSFIVDGPETAGRAVALTVAHPKVEDVLTRLAGTFVLPLRSLEGVEVAAFRPCLFLLPTLGMIYGRFSFQDQNHGGLGTSYQH